MKKSGFFILVLCLCIVFASGAVAQTSMGNVLDRKTISLNGKWKVIIDPNDAGERMGIGKDAKAITNTDFLEYSFDDAQTLLVPGDFNSQLPELTYYEKYSLFKRNRTMGII